MPSLLVIESSKLLKSHHLTIAFAESATAGRLSAEFALDENSGKILIGGLVCYDACVKEEILGIPVPFIEKYTPESAEVTKELAERLKKFMKSDIQVAVTGLTAPGGSETPQKPVGTMFIHLVMKDKSVGIREEFGGSPESIIMQTVDKVAELLIMHIV
ncbi:CinA family protein [Runella slithyformis]|uniref:CinA domain protein n=1 Tax=Runella slithyformis (strain ATCC 29530 / DSM 19594 / LMG 11500 / NCIMB 11436 / LSU 4) TaxID=761193 RepID=A0A7U3ZRY3_RUNSL|nr:CinA family protein [Runella slithyformis]AEI52250.1 CinA domain protein [Runella slithyformis DSM 19594]